MHPRNSILLLLSAAGSVDAVRMHGASARGSIDAKLSSENAVALISNLVSEQQNAEVPDMLHFGKNALSLLMTKLGSGEETCTDASFEWWCKFLERMQAAPQTLIIILLKTYTSFSSAREWFTASSTTRPIDSTEWNDATKEFMTVFRISVWSAFDSGASDDWKDSVEGKAAYKNWLDGWDETLGPLRQAFKDVEAGNSDTAWQPVLKKAASTLISTLNIGAPLHVELWATMDTALQSTIKGWENFVSEKWVAAFGDVWTALYALYEPLFVGLWEASIEEKACATIPDDTTPWEVASQKTCEKIAVDATKTIYQFKPGTATEKALCFACDNVDSLLDAVGWTIYQKPLVESEVKKRLDQVNTIVEKIKANVEEFEKRSNLPCDESDDKGGFCICTRTTVARKSTPVSRCYHGFTFDSKQNVCIARNDNGADCEGACTPGGNLGKECPEFCPSNKRYCCKQGAGGVCDRAMYVNLEFAEGSPSDYYQCVSPAVEVGDSATQLFQEPLEVSTLVQQAAPQESSSLLLQRAWLGAEARSLSSLDRSTSRKGGNTEPAATPNGASSPVCDPNSEFNEEIAGNAGKCFEPCPSGYAAVLTEDEPPVLTTNCLQSCEISAGVGSGNIPLSKEAKFGISVGGDGASWDVCAITTGFAKTKSDDSVTILTNTITELVATFQKLSANSDLTSEELDKAASAVSDAYAYLKRPPCGQELVPAPTPAPEP